MYRGRQEALLRHLRGRGEEAGVPDFRTDDERSLQRSGDRLKQELINMAGKALVRMPCFCIPSNLHLIHLRHCSHYTHVRWVYLQACNW